LGIAKIDVLSLIELGNYAEAGAAVDSFIADFNDHLDLPEALYWGVAGAYERAKRYDKAKSIYQQITQLYPETLSAIRAPLDVAKINILLLIESGDDPNAQLAVDKLIVDFSDYADFARVISNIEEGYYIRTLASEAWQRENYVNPLVIWEKVTSKFPDFFHPDPDLYYFIACCYYQLGEYENAIEYCGIVLDKWPDYKYAFGAQALMDVCFEKLTNAGE